MVAWGKIYDGTNYVVAAAPADLRGVTAIAAGRSHTVALKNDGTVVAWGFSYYGQTTAPAGLSGVTAIAAGSYYTVALKDNGAVVVWGVDARGRGGPGGGRGRRWPFAGCPSGRLRSPTRGGRPD